MAKTSYSLSHTKWMCKYHIVFTPKYRRKSIYYKIRQDLIDIFRHLCRYKGVEIIEGHMMPDHVHMLVLIPPKLSISILIFQISVFIKYHESTFAFQISHKNGNRKFWARGYYVSTVGLNEKTVAKYIREQEKNDIALDKLSVKEYEDPFK